MREYIPKVEAKAIFKLEIMLHMRIWHYKTTFFVPAEGFSQTLLQRSLYDTHFLLFCFGFLPVEQITNTK